MATHTRRNRQTGTAQKPPPQRRASDIAADLARVVRDCNRELASLRQRVRVVDCSVARLEARVSALSFVAQARGEMDRQRSD